MYPARFHCFIVRCGVEDPDISGKPRRSRNRTAIWVCPDLHKVHVHFMHMFRRTVRQVYNSQIFMSEHKIQLVLARLACEKISTSNQTAAKNSLTVWMMLRFWPLWFTSARLLVHFITSSRLLRSFSPIIVSISQIAAIKMQSGKFLGWEKEFIRTSLSTVSIIASTSSIFRFSSTTGNP
jgi:hypothetical protein